MPDLAAPLRATFDRLLAEEGAALGRVARVYARDPGEAADLAQEIAVAVWLALPQFRGESSERTFVFRIAHNRGISFAARRRARERTTPLGAGDEDATDPRPTPEEALDVRRRRDALLRALAELPLGARAVIALDLEGLTHQEIADVLGSTPNSVAVRLHRARAVLRERLSTMPTERSPHE